MLDAYTVRKAVPRILIAVIGINLSIYFCLAALDVSTIVGRGIDGLLMSTFKDADAFAVVSPDTTGEGVLATLLAGGTLFALGGSIIGGLLPFIALVGLLALAIMFTLILTQALIIFLTIVSPVAIACFILPGTEKYFQKWLDLFIKTLMIYPIIYSILAMSKVMAAILIGTSSLSPDAIGGVKVFAAILVIYAPLALIPFAFKLAGGAIGAIGGMAVGRAQQTGAGIKKGMRENPDSLSSRLRRKVDNKYSDAGLTGGQMWAGATGGLRKGKFGTRADARQAKRRSAREFDQFRNLQSEMQTGRYKMNSQDSDVLQSMVMTKDEIAKDVQNLQLAAAAGQGNTYTNADGKVKSGGGISQREYSRRMQAHSNADAMGRTTANMQAAALSADRIKFTSADHAGEMAMLTRVFGEEGISSAANAHQAIAKGPGARSDLAASLYGDAAVVGKAASHTSESELMTQQHSNAVKGVIDDQVALLQSPAANYKQKKAAFDKLAGLKAQARNNPYGKSANKAVVSSNAARIDAAVSGFVNDPAMQTQAKIYAADTNPANHTEDIFAGKQVATGETRTVQTAVDGVEVTQPMMQNVSGSDAAMSRFNEAAGRQLSPAELAAAAAQQGGQQPQGQGQQGGGNNP